MVKTGLVNVSARVMLMVTSLFGDSEIGDNGILETLW